MANKEVDQPETPQSGRRDKTSDTGQVGGGAEDMRSIADEEGDEELEDTEDPDEEEEDQDNRA